MRQLLRVMRKITAVGAVGRALEIVDSERQGLWAYYYVIPDALEELSTWLS